MRIAVINATLYLGGAGLIARDVAQGLVRAGHEVCFICTGPSPSRTHQGNLTVETLPFGDANALAHYLNPTATATLTAALARFKPDVVNFHNVNMRSFSAASLLLSRRYPTAWTLHDVWPVCMTGWPEPPDCLGMHGGCRRCPTWPRHQARANRLIKDRIFSQVRLTVVCPSQWMADTIGSSPLAEQPIEVLRNGVDPELFAPQPGSRAALGLDPEQRWILFSGGKRVSGTSPAFRKGWDDLRAALERLGRDRLARTGLLYVGDPIELPEDFPLPVRFVGGVEREQMPALYSAADLCVLPTLGDNAPLGVLEAMATGTPVLASRTGGIPEVITHDHTGLLVPTRDPAALADALLTALDDPTLRARLATAARAHLLTELTLQRMCDRYEALLTALADG